MIRQKGASYCYDMISIYVGLITQETVSALASSPASLLDHPGAATHPSPSKKTTDRREIGDGLKVIVV